MNTSNRYRTTTTTPFKRRRLESDVTPIRELSQRKQEKLQNELYRLRKENTRLAAVGRANSLTISKLATENQRVLKKCSAYRIAAKQTLEREKAESQQQLHDCQAEVTKLQKEVGRLGDKKKYLVQKLKDAREDIDGLQQYAFASDQSIARSSHQYEVDLSSLQNKNKALKAKIESASTSLSKLGRENQVLLQQCRDTKDAKDGLEREKAAIQEKHQAREKAFMSLRVQLELNNIRCMGLKSELENATKTIGALQQCVRERDCSIDKVKAECDANMHQLHLQSHKSLLVIQGSNDELKRRVLELESMLADDAQCMNSLFDEREESQQTVVKQQKNTVVLNSEVDDQLRLILQRHRDTLKQVQDKFGKGDSTESNQQLIRDKIELQQIVAELKAKHSEEVDELQEEIEQMKMNHAVELGFLQG